jgi:GTP 3',8-cyclase
LRAALRNSDKDDAFHTALDAALAQKPEGHLFEEALKEALPATSRHMNVTGG